MSRLIETYNEINQHIKELSDKIHLNVEKKGSIDSRRNNEIPDRILNLEEQLKKIDEYKLKIEGFRLLAEKNIDSKNVLTIEAPPGYRVNLNRLRNWSMMIDPMTENDPYAQRVYVVAKCDEFFLEKKKQKFLERIEQLKNDFNTGDTEELRGIEAEIENLKHDLNLYISSDEVNDFSNEVVRGNNGYIFEECPEVYVPDFNENNIISPGAIGFPLAFDEADKKILKTKMGKFYDEKGGRVYLPFEDVSTEKEFGITVSCIPSRKKINEMDAGIRNLLFNFINNSKPGSRKVYILDAERQNSALVGSLKNLEGTFALAEIARNKEQISSKLEEIISTFADIDELLDHYDSVVEYNASVEESHQIERKIIVLVGWPKTFSGRDAEFVSRIITNYERYGISFIAVSIKNEINQNEDFGISEYLNEDIIHVSMSGKDTTLTHGNKVPFKFVWYTFNQELKDTYIKSLREHIVQNSEIGNEYTKRYDLDTFPEYTRGNKNIVLPFGIDSKDKVQSISFDNENFASFLMGASGSGKSTLIHTLITGIVKNYHPDDVELWLADFKMSEFAQYMKPMPPHVKYILLDESNELIYDLIDKLTEKMMERQRFFMSHKEMKKVENVSIEIYMPVIFVLFDEFSIMSQAVSESEVYKLKLQNLLAKGRALGIKFLFASQTFTKGVSGLTATAKEQIQSRIAMKNSREEISETLQLSSSLKTEQVRNWLEALPPHYALYKYRDGENLNVKRLHVMYFDGNGNDAYDQQRKLIDNINSNMEVVDIDKYDYKRIDAYVDKKPVVVDGNSYEGFRRELLMEGIADLQKNSDIDMEDEIYISFGSPRLMANQKLISVLPESRENIFVLGSNNDRACTAATVNSAIESFLAQGKKVQIWAYPKDRLYGLYKDVWIHNENVEIIEGIDAVCDEIRKINEDIGNGKVEQRLIVQFGMNRIYSDFEFIDDKITGKTMINKSEDVASIKNSFIATGAIIDPEKDILTKMKGELYRKERSIRIEGKKANWSEDVIKGEVQKARDEIESRYVDLLEEGQQHSRIKEKIVYSDKILNKNEDIERGAYNATKDFENIFKQGSRLGIHVLTVVYHVADLKSMNLKLNFFRHRIAFQCSTEESNEIFSNRIASKLPEHICQYSDTLDKFSFRPYLHEKIIWDGWNVDEHGNAVNRFNE